MNRYRRAIINSKWGRRIYIVVATGLLVCVACMLAAKWMIESASENRCYDEAASVPHHQVGLVLGCSRYLADGRQNLFFKNRIEAASELYEAGCVDYFLVSGDNSRKDYDESSDMKSALIEAGVPEDLIYCDYAGFSTLDSVVRAKRVFQLAEVVVISQDFHVKRAVYIGKQRGVTVTGYIADGVGGGDGIRTQFRECLARVKTVLDVTLLNRQPVYLGEPIQIGV